MTLVLRRKSGVNLVFNAKTMFGYVQNYQNGFNPERLKNHEAEADEIIRQHAACATFPIRRNVSTGH